MKKSRNHHTIQLTKTTVSLIILATVIGSFLTGRWFHFYNARKANASIIHPMDRSHDGDDECLLEVVVDDDNNFGDVDAYKPQDETNTPAMIDSNDNLYGHYHWNDDNVMVEFLDLPDMMLHLVGDIFDQVGLQYGVKNECHNIEPTGLICTLATQKLHFAIQSRIKNGSPRLEYYLNGKQPEIKQIYNTIHDMFKKESSYHVQRRIVQEHREGKEVYHEALVHPMLVAHSDPKRVAILKSADNEWVLKEVLKHKTVEQVNMYEYFDLNYTSLQEWQNCSDIIDVGTQRCVDDERVHTNEANIFSVLNSSEDDVEMFDVAIINM